MPTVLCPGCGKAVKFEGVAGVCPSCASIVRGPRPAGASAGAGERAERPAGTRPSGRRPAAESAGQLADLEGIGGEGAEVFDPGAGDVYEGSGRRGGPFGGLDKNVVYAIAGALALVLLFGLYEVFAPSRSNPALNVPPPPVAPKVVKPPTAVDDGAAEPEPPPPPDAIPEGPTAAATRPSWYGVKPARPKLTEPPITDAKVERALIRGADYLKSNYADGQIKLPGRDAEEAGGGDALCTYALLHTGEAINDADLNSSSAFMKDALAALKRANMAGGKETYGHALRAMALGLFNRPEDRDVLTRDRDWLIKCAVHGAYGYTMPAAGANTNAVDFWFDHSNSQYGVLGVWAASEAGLPASDKYWKDVEQHWLANQDQDGGWNYQSSVTGGSTLTMTAAGVTTMCVAGEQQVIIARKGEKGTGAQKFSDAVNRGVEWLGAGDHMTTFTGDKGYAYYGVERAALATGYRYFGDHDWYREIGAKALAAQDEGGSWKSEYSPAAGTAFHLLFLARGRQPLLMDKLRFDGDWNDRPRDVAKLTAFASSKLEKPFAWGVADLSRSWSDWLDAPVLLISTDAAPTFADDECDKLRSYADAGGFILFQAEFGDKAVAAAGRDLAKRLYPNYPLAKVAPADPLYKAAIPVDPAKAKPEVGLEVVSNGSRPLFVLAPTDLSQDWVKWRAKDAGHPVGAEEGVNLFIAAAGKSDFRNRLNSPYVGPSEVPPVATVPVQLVRYPGGRWNPEPAAWTRFARYFQNETSVALDPQPTDLKDVDRGRGPIAVLTGNADVDFAKLDLHALHDFVDGGGTLLVDATGGGPAFVKAIHDSLLPAAFAGGRPLAGIPAADLLLSGRLACSDALPKPRVRRFVSELLAGAPAPGIQYATFGRGLVVVSDLDLTTGLLAASTYAVQGYTPAYANSFVKNTVLWTLSRYANLKPPPPPPTSAPATAPVPTPPAAAPPLDQQP